MMMQSTSSSFTPSGSGREVGFFSDRSTGEKIRSSYWESPETIGLTASVGWSERLPSSIQETLGLDELIRDTFRMLAALQADEELPEVFDLRPQRKIRIQATVKSVKQAKFHFVDDLI